MFDDVRTRLNDAWIATRQQQADWTPGWTPQPHDLCYVFDPSATADVWRAYAATQEHPFKSRKLATNWHGPYLVERMENPSTVVVIVPYKRGKGTGPEIAWRERFPLRHVRQHCQESFVDRPMPGAVWVPAAVIAKRPSADGDVEYHVRDVNAVDMSTRQVWRSAELVPAELVQCWLDQLWFEELRTTKPVVKDPAKLLQNPAVVPPSSTRVRDRFTPGLSNAPSLRVAKHKHTPTARTAGSTPALPPSQSTSARRRSRAGRLTGKRP
jgi:hypothetical protein